MPAKNDHATRGEDWHRPLRDLLLSMPYLSVTPEAEIDYAAADPALLVQLAEDAEITLNTIHRGVSAIGLLMAYTAPESETRDLSADVTEALGFLLAELGDFAAVAHCLSAACRRFTADYAPQVNRHVRSARP